PIAARCRRGKANAAALPRSQFLAVEAETLQRALPIPAAAVDKVHDEQVFQLFQVCEAEAVRGGHGLVQLEMFANVRVPAVEQAAAQGGAGKLEVHDHVDTARPLERPVNPVEAAVAGEDVDDAFGDGDAVQGGEEN